MAKQGDRIYRLDDQLDRAFAEYLDRTRFSQQMTIERLLDWYLAQDQVVQMMVLGAVDATKEHAHLIAEKLVERSGKRIGARGVKAIPRAGGAQMPRAAKVKG